MDILRIIWTKERIDRLKYLKSIGLFHADIAKEMNCTQSAIDNACFKFRNC